MIVKDSLSFKLSIGLIIIFCLNFIFTNYIALNYFSLFASIFYLIPLYLYLPSNIFFVLYSQKKISKYATIGFTLGLISQVLSFLFNFGFLSSTISYSYIIPSFIMYITIMLICSIPVVLYLNSLIFRRRNKITSTSEIKLELAHLPKFIFKLLLILGVLLIIVSIITYIIRYNLSVYMVTAPQRFGVFVFEQLLFVYVYLFEYLPKAILNQQLGQLSNLFFFMAIFGIILIIFSIIKLKTYSYRNKNFD
ncbi:MAG: hypothetical protein ACTSRG_19630 [Candidatus Helarchaeota archaeon]